MPDNNVIKDPAIRIERIPIYSDPVPGRTFQETVQVCPPGEWRLVGYEAVDLFRAAGQVFALGAPVFRWVVPLCRNVTRTVTIAPIPPRLIGYRIVVDEGPNLGWNAGARSDTFLATTGRFEFKVRANAVGVVVGLDTAINENYDYRTWPVALYARKGEAFFLEYGGIVSGAIAYTDATVFRITRSGVRSGSNISYSVDSTPYGGPAFVLQGPLIAKAALYAAYDEVFDPEFRTLTGGNPATLPPGLGGASFELEPFRGFSGETTAVAEYARAFVRLRPLTASARVLPRARVRLQPLNARASNTTSARAYVRLQPLTGTAGVDGLQFAPGYGVVYGTLAPMQGYARGLTGGIGGVENAVLRPFRLIASEGPYSRVDATLQPFAGAAMSYGAGEQHLASYGAASDDISPLLILVVPMTSDVAASEVYTVQLLRDASMQAEIDADASFSLDSLLSVVINSFVGLQDIDSMSQAGGQVWVLNLDTGGSTSYTNYQFNSFGVLAGHAFGVRSDGIYRLEGDTDAGAVIPVTLDFGRRDFGTPALKRLESAYFGVGTYGTLYLRVTDNEGNAYVYAARRSETSPKQHRVDVGRGFLASMIRFELLNYDPANPAASGNGADFELESVEFVAAELTRKIR